jgi:hypothetical protein
MNDPLSAMTQDKWDRLTPAERDRLRSDDNLSPQLRGLEGCRVEVVDKYGERRRFIVGRSTGWRPCHLEVKTARSFGGMAADREYTSVHVIKKVRR